jgi:hypothetical protein
MRHNERMKLMEQKRAAKSFYAAIGAIALILTGCQNSSSTQAKPTAEPGGRIYDNASTLTTVQIGHKYRFNLLTHCGVEYLRFDGQMWKADTYLGDIAHNPPRDWPQPFALGYVTLANVSKLTFTLPGKTPVTFHVTVDQVPICS